MVKFKLKDLRLSFKDFLIGLFARIVLLKNFMVILENHIIEELY